MLKDAERINLLKVKKYLYYSEFGSHYIIILSMHFIEDWSR
jgi:hypothetical protein